jgi:hypothetical protein
VNVVALRQISSAQAGGSRGGVASGVERALRAAHCAIAAAAPGSLGHIKLNIALWYADIEHYRRVGASVTGLTDYARTPHGPFSKQISRAITLLAKQGAVVERAIEGDKFARRGIFSLRDFAPESLSETEVGILRRSAEAVAGLTAKQLNEAVAADPLWQETATGAVMLVATGSVVTRSSLAFSSEEREQASYKSNPRPVPFRQSPPSEQPEPS